MPTDNPLLAAEKEAYLPITRLIQIVRGLTADQAAEAKRQLKNYKNSVPAKLAQARNAAGGDHAAAITLNVIMKQFEEAVDAALARANSGSARVSSKPAGKREEVDWDRALAKREAEKARERKWWQFWK